MDLALAAPEFALSLKTADPFFADFYDEDLHFDGAQTCLSLQQNRSVESTLQLVVDAYDTSESSTQTFFRQSVEKLCPSVSPILDDPEWFEPTAVALRSTVGVSSKEWKDESINRFANSVCDAVDRGATPGRLSIVLADEHGFPDDLAEVLVDDTQTYC